MTDDAKLIYLEPDDEITTVVRRLREADGARVILVAPGRTKATTSAVGLRLLAGVAREDGREIVLVGDAGARSLAGEAGIAAVASVAEARSLHPGATPSVDLAPERARISVVRGERRAALSTRSAQPPSVASAGSAPPVSRLDETLPVPVLKPPPPTPRRRRERPFAPQPATRRPPSAIGLAAMALVLVAGVAGAAVVLPGATVHIAPVTQPIGPFTYLVPLPVAGLETGTLTASADGTATGDDPQLVAATGSVTLLNYNSVPVEIPKGLAVSGGGARFLTQELATAPKARFTGQRIRPGEVSVRVTAADPGPGGNVAAEVIDTIENRLVDFYLTFPGADARHVINPEATSGGAESHRPKVEQADVDTVVSTLQRDIAAQLDAVHAANPDRLYATAGAPQPEIAIPNDLVGRVGEATFSLQATLAYSLPYVVRDDATAGARGPLDADAGAIPSGMQVVPDSVTVTLGDAVADGSTMTVQATVTGAVAAAIDPDAIRRLVADRTPEEARTALAGFGASRIDLWPGWVDRVTGLGWRIAVDIESAAVPAASASPNP